MPDEENEFFESCFQQELQALALPISPAEISFLRQELMRLLEENNELSGLFRAARPRAHLHHSDTLYVGEEPAIASYVAGSGGKGEP